MLKSFLFCKSFPPQPSLFLLQDSLHGFPRLFTVTSEHIRFYFLVWGIHIVSPEEEKEGCGGKDLQKKKALSLE